MQVLLYLCAEKLRDLLRLVFLKSKYLFCYLSVAGAKGKDGILAAADSSPGAVQDRCQAHLTVQRGDQKPVWCVDGHSGGDGGL